VKIDTLRALFTYLTALLVIVGGGAFLYYTRLDPDPSQLQLVVSGFMGAAVGWVFSSESSGEPGILRSSARQNRLVWYGSARGDGRPSPTRFLS
jgi:hypothetical protein